MSTTTRATTQIPPQQSAPKYTVEELFNIEQEEAYGYDPAYYSEENSWNYYSQESHPSEQEEHQYIHYEEEANFPEEAKTNEET
jgi:hypothetical protein